MVLAFGAMDDLIDHIKANSPDGVLEDVAVGPFGHLLDGRGSRNDAQR
jgi:hypothetical protein